MTLPTNSVYEFGEFRLDPRRRLLTRLNGEPVPLTAKAFDSLVYFVQHAGETVTRASLTATLWPSTIVEENNLSQAISVLRRTLGAECVATVTRRGYQFTPQVRIVTDAAATSVSSIAAPRVAPPRAGRTLVAAAAAAVLLVGVAIALVRAPQDRAATGALNGYAFIKLTEFEGAEEHAAISRDGRLAAFLRERDGTWDVWIGQIGTGEFRNLTSGSVPELRNPAVRTLGFSPEGSNVVMWTRTSSGADSGLVDGGWVVPALGEGGLRPFFNGVAELDWSPDGARIVYHTAAPGDPLFVADTEDRAGGRQIASTCGHAAHATASPAIAQHEPTGRRVTTRRAAGHARSRPDVNGR
jgi:DNA-binding winged helix-turn-helix (wHTH) protein